MNRHSKRLKKIEDIYLRIKASDLTENEKLLYELLGASITFTQFMIDAVESRNKSLTILNNKVNYLQVLTRNTKNTLNDLIDLVSDEVDSVQEPNGFY